MIPVDSVRINAAAFFFARGINAAAKHVKSSEQKEEEKKHTARRHPYQPEEGNRLGRS